jgi:hypothetical protein
MDFLEIPIVDDYPRPRVRNIGQLAKLLALFQHRSSLVTYVAGDYDAGFGCGYVKTV